MILMSVKGQFCSVLRYFQVLGQQSWMGVGSGVLDQTVAIAGLP